MSTFSQIMFFEVLLIVAAAYVCSKVLPGVSYTKTVDVKEPIPGKKVTVTNEEFLFG